MVSLLKLTETGASGEKLERNGSSVRHRVHASGETPQNCQGRPPPLPPAPFSLLHSGSNRTHPPTVLLSMNDPPSVITKLHTHFALRLIVAFPHP